MRTQVCCQRVIYLFYLSSCGVERKTVVVVDPEGRIKLIGNGLPFVGKGQLKDTRRILLQH